MEQDREPKGSSSPQEPASDADPRDDPGKSSGGLTGGPMSLSADGTTSGGLGSGANPGTGGGVGNWEEGGSAADAGSATEDQNIVYPPEQARSGAAAIGAPASPAAAESRATRRTRKAIPGSHRRRRPASTTVGENPSGADHTRQ